MRLITAYCRKYCLPMWLSIRPISRRSGLQSVLFCVLIAMVACAPSTTMLPPRPTITISLPTGPKDCAHAYQSSNPVAVENTCQGDLGWRVDARIGPDHAIEGFTNPSSVNIGGTIHLYVSTTSPTYTFSIYRMGWYGGNGGRNLYTSGTLVGTNQAVPIFDSVTHEVSCKNWKSPVTISIPTTWVSGFYLVKMLSSAGYMRYTPFIVRNDSSTSSILYTASFVTYQAYNTWGGYNLYHRLAPEDSTAPGDGESATPSSSEQRAFIVSFDRPYAQNDGLMDFPSYEFAMIRWLERQPYTVSYAADLDLDTLGSHLRQHRLLLISGHDEYWSTHMRANVTAARDAGVSLAFFGANDVYWHVRLQGSPFGKNREIVCYKHGYYKETTRDSTDPVAASNSQEATVLWRDPPLNQPEDALLGEMYHSGTVGITPLVMSAGAVPYLSGTDLVPGSGVRGIVGGEYDSYTQDDSTPNTLTVLTASAVRCKPTKYCHADGKDISNATIYTAASGAQVLDVGTFYWARGLDIGLSPDDSIYISPGLERFTANLLNSLLSALHAS